MFNRPFLDLNESTAWMHNVLEIHLCHLHVHLHVYNVTIRWAQDTQMFLVTREKKNWKTFRYCRGKKNAFLTNMFIKTKQKNNTNPIPHCSNTSELNPRKKKKRDKFKIIMTFCFLKKTKKRLMFFFLKRRKTMYPGVEDLIRFFTEDEEGCCCCCFCFCCCCSLSYMKETAGGEGISPITLLPPVDGPSTPPQTAPCIKSAASSLLFHKEWWLIYNLMHVDRKREYHKIS